MTENEVSTRLEVIRAGLLSGTDVEVVSSAENIEAIDTVIDAIEELKRYRAIGTPEECRAAVEKQTAKNLIFDKPLMALSCPTCGHYAQEVVDDDGSTRGNIPKYCSRCGQRLYRGVM